jgi:hypothetical protein
MRQNEKEKISAGFGDFFVQTLQIKTLSFL